MDIKERLRRINANSFYGTGQIDRDRMIKEVEDILRRGKMSEKRMKEEPDWIPVSEQLPEETDDYLCCDEDGYIAIGFFSISRQEWCFNEKIDNVIAWMPLPKPYRTNKEEKQCTNTIH